MERGKKPPPRRTASLREVENSYQTEGVRELSIPARHIRVPTVDGGNILSSYMRNIQLPPNLANHGESTTPAQVDKSMYLFHGCGNAIDAQVINSFARWGPSIRFSRPRSYLSPGQAVYWTNSIEFAVAWSFFAEYGHWDLESIQPNRPFRCLVSVSKLDLTRVSFEGGLYLIPAPQTAEDEDQLREVSQPCKHSLHQSPFSCCHGPVEQEQESDQYG